MSARQVRWQTFLSEFNLEVAYLPGKANILADGLSRRAHLRLCTVASLAPYDDWSRIKEKCKVDIEVSWSSVAEAQRLIF